MFKKVIIIMVIIILAPILVAVGVTLHIPCLEKVPISNDWIVFWASYAAILVSVGMPIYLFRKQREEDRRQSAMTILSAYQYNGLIQTKDNDLTQNERGFIWTIDYIWEEGKFSSYVLSDRQHQKYKDKVTGKDYFRTELIVRNIGNAPAIDLKIYMDGGKKEPDSSISIGSKELALYKFYIPGNILSRSNNKLIFEFKDMYQNKYTQSITFGTSFSKEKGYQLTNFSPISKIESIQEKHFASCLKKSERKRV